MTDEGDGEQGTARRARVKELDELLRALDERPGDLTFAAKLVIAEQTGTEARLDTASFVMGSAHLAITCMLEERMEEAARWLERSEAAREEASLPVLVDINHFAEAAYRVGEYWSSQGLGGKAISIWSRAAAIYDEMEDLDIFSRHRYGIILRHLAWDRFDSVEAGVKAALGVEPADIARIRDLLAEPLRLFQRSCEVLTFVLYSLPGAAGMWANNQLIMALCHDTSDRLGEALECYDRIIELHRGLIEFHRAGLSPGELTGAWRSRADCLRRLGRRVEALMSWQNAVERAEESGDPELLEAVRTEMDEAASGLTEGTA